MLLQTLNALFFWGLPASQELNQQLANHFTAKVRHFMHTSQVLLAHMGYLQHACTACIHQTIQTVLAARPTAAWPATGASSCFAVASTSASLDPEVCSGLSRQESR